MRILSFVFLFIFAVNISAQTTDPFIQGTRQINAGRFDDALTTYKAALVTGEKKYVGKEYLARLHYNIGLCYFHLDRFEAATNEFKSAVLLKADYVRAHDALRMVDARRSSLRAKVD